MIRVHWQRKGDCLIGFRVTGHAGYAEHGQDIVCAAVSALAQTAVIALERLTEGDIAVNVQEGSLECQLGGAGEHGSRAWVILESMRLGLQEIATHYPKYVRIDDQEV